MLQIKTTKTDKNSKFQWIDKEIKTEVSKDAFLSYLIQDYNKKQSMKPIYNEFLISQIYATSYNHKIYCSESINEIKIEAEKTLQKLYKYT